MTEDRGVVTRLGPLGDLAVLGIQWTRLQEVADALSRPDPWTLKRRDAVQGFTDAVAQAEQSWGAQAPVLSFGLSISSADVLPRPPLGAPTLEQLADRAHEAWRRFEGALVDAATERVASQRAQAVTCEIAAMIRAAARP